MGLTYYIDAYNVLHQVPELERLANTNLESAREGLTELVGRYCNTAGIVAHLVFDGRGSTRHRIDSSPSGPSLRVVFTAQDTSADAYIEREVYKVPDRSKLVVVTKDRAIGAVCSGLGALVIGPATFISEMASASSEFHRENASRKAGGTLERVEDRLNEKSRAALERLKDRFRR